MSGDGAPEAPWSLPGELVLGELDSQPEGLSPAEAARRLQRWGPNALETERAPGPAAILVRQFKSPLIYILLFAAAVTVALDEYVDTAVIAAVLVFNAVVGFLQEYRAERSLEALERLARTDALVIRGGGERRIDARELVPGDLVLIEAGAKVPADCRVVHQTALEADESLLTGESGTVSKNADPVEAEAVVADRHGMVHMGTVITRGHARVVVVATGALTELGRVAGSVGSIGSTETPLQRRMARFTRLIGIWALASSLLGFGLGAAAGEDLDELFRAMIALAVAALPEGLPIVLTITLAISVNRMARRRAIVRRLPAVETLGSCTVIASDKTGTLTQNRMTVTSVWAGGELFAVSGPGDSIAGGIGRGGLDIDPDPGSPLARTLLAGALANEASIPDPADLSAASGDPTEVALLVAAAKAGMFKDELEERYARLADIPFDPSRRFAATINRADGGGLLNLKGAPEQVLEMCADAAGEGGLDRERILAEAHAMAAEGLRVLAMAQAELGPGELDAERVREHPRGLTFLGLQGMIDPPREEAREAVRLCRRAGVRTVMITGDHASTGLAIAAKLEIAGPEDRAVTGSELDSLGDAELERLVRQVPVYARVSPEHKLRIVEALQRGGEVVAVTGDGVNDAPALKRADIGAAMGRSGTDVAKEAADLVVSDDNFATIVAAVEEGRAAFDNVRKTTFFLISSNAAAVLAVLVSLGAGFALPFVAVQLLWLNLVTNGVQDIALAFEPPEPHLLDRRPRPADEGVISPVLWERTAIAAVVMATGTLALFQHKLNSGGSIEQARTVALTAMVVFQALHVGNSRSEYLSVFAKSPFSNRFLIVGTVAALAIHAGALYLPLTQIALSLEPLSVANWGLIFLTGLSVIVAVEIHKRIRRPRAAAAATATL